MAFDKYDAGTVVVVASAGANALIGGNKVVLQPLSVSGNIGINLAAGIGDISLTYVGGPAPVLREFVPFGAQ